MQKEYYRIKRGSQPMPDTGATGPTRNLAAIVRAHLVEAKQEGAQAEVMRREGQPDQAQPWNVWLILRTDATTDEFAKLRFGTYIVEWFNPVLKVIERLDAGYFIGESLSSDEQKLIQDYCRTQNLNCMKRREWLKRVFFKYGYRGGGAIVGFNLPLSVSRIAVRASVIRIPKPTEKNPVPNGITKLFAGGFRFPIFEYEKKKQPGQWRERAYRPSVWIKPISPRAAMYRWGFFKGWQEKGEGFYSGHFLDLRTLGHTLSVDERNANKVDSLEAMCERFGLGVKKAESHEHGGLLTEAYLGDALISAEATLSLYYAELEEYNKHELNVTQDRIYSSASLGKAYLKTMGLQTPPLLNTNDTDYSEDQVMGFGMSAYYSGRSEAQIVNLLVPVTYVDFHAMYPAVCVLQGLWDFMKAERVIVADATQATIEFLQNLQVGDLYNPETWKRLPVLCLVEPRGDVLPVRADYRWRRPQGSSLSYRIALAEVLSAKEPMWYTLADVLASYLKTGRMPYILQALKFTPDGSRALTPLSIRGGPVIDPDHEDFFRALVEARDGCEADQKLADALKIVANSTSYGIWAEVDIEDGERPVTAFSTDQRKAIIPHGEKPGRYYFPPLAAFITSGGRLMLALLEHEIEQRGGLSAFCDTDSLAVLSAEQDGVLSYTDHKGRADQLPLLTWAQLDGILNNFESLNPCRSGKPLIKLEKENFEEKNPARPRIDLHAYVIAAKRYGLFVPPDWIVKVSYHTLGIVEPPRDEEGFEIEGWIEELWRHKVRGLHFSPPWANQPVEFRLDISRPEILRSFRKLWSGAHIETGNKYMNAYLPRVKPFSSVAVLAKTQEKFSMTKLESDRLKGVPVIAPVSLNGKADKRHWLAKNSGKLVNLLPPEELIGRSLGMSDEDLEKEIETYRMTRELTIQEIERQGGLFTTYMTFEELMANYLGHHENKTVDRYGEETSQDTRGLLSRPRVRITELVFTGKETVLQEEVERGIVSPEEAEGYRFVIRPERDEVAELVFEVLRLLSKAELRRLRISRTTAEKIKSGVDSLSLKGASNQSRFVAELINYLEVQYPDEVGDAEGEETLRTFAENRKHLLEVWEALQPMLPELSAKELAQIAGCSPREAIRIKKGEAAPGIGVIRQILNSM